MQALLQESESKVEQTTGLITQKQDYILDVEQVLAKCQSDLADQEKKLNDALQAEVFTDILSGYIILILFASFIEQLN